MTASQLLLVLKARLGLVILLVVATLGVGILASYLLPKKYLATAAVLVDVRSPDPLSSLIDRGAIPVPSLLAAQVDILKSERVSQRVIAMRKMDQDPAILEQWKKATDGKDSIDDWLVELMKRRLSVRPSGSGAVVSVGYEDKDPGVAASLANSFVQAWIETDIDLRVEQSRQYFQWFKEQSDVLRDRLERARRRLAEYQRNTGIVARDERLDVETVKLQELSSRLAIVQSQTAEAAGKQVSGRSGDTLPEVAQNPLIVSLKGDIVRQSARLEELGSNLGRNHPQYQSAAAELNTLKHRLDIETKSIMSGFNAAKLSGRGSEAALRTAIEEQQKKVLQMRVARDEIAVLQRDVDAAQASYDAVSKRFAQISLESQARQSNVSIYSPAVAPNSHASPNVPYILVAALFLGVCFGVGTAVGLEVLDPRIRSSDEVVEMLPFPVLGVIPHAKLPRRTTSQAKLAAVQPS